MTLSSWRLKKALSIGFNIRTFTTTEIAKVSNTVIDVGRFMCESRGSVLTDHIRHDKGYLGTVIVGIVVNRRISTSHSTIVAIVFTDWTIDFANWRIDICTVFKLAVAIWPTWPTMTPDIVTFPDRNDNILEQSVLNLIGSQSLPEIKIVNLTLSSQINLRLEFLQGCIVFIGCTISHGVIGWNQEHLSLIKIQQRKNHLSMQATG